jgi:hypothetical protein
LTLDKALRAQAFRSPCSGSISLSANTGSIDCLIE